MRQAREWFASKFHATTVEEVQKIAPQGSQENAYLRMVTSYWDMAASFVTSGILNEELFLQTNGELLFVWEKVRGLAEANRTAMKNPNIWKNLETVGNAAIKRMQATAPEGYQAFSAMIKGMAAGRS
ncbi:MAG TPA: hypothetical protein VJ732_06365 [Bryobacteraceae bacterium]|nr:hypothetical protein [Bryobacteraceae bacterium]